MHRYSFCHNSVLVWNTAHQTFSQVSIQPKTCVCSFFHTAAYGCLLCSTVNSISPQRPHPLMRERVWLAESSSLARQGQNSLGRMEMMSAHEPILGFSFLCLTSMSCFVVVTCMICAVSRTRLSCSSDPVQVILFSLRALLHLFVHVSCLLRTCAFLYLGQIEMLMWSVSTFTAALFYHLM